MSLANVGAYEYRLLSLSTPTGRQVCTLINIYTGAVPYAKCNAKNCEDASSLNAKEKS